MTIPLDSQARTAWRLWILIAGLALAAAAVLSPLPDPSRRRPDAAKHCRSKPPQGRGSHYNATLIFSTASRVKCWRACQRS